MDIITEYVPYVVVAIVAFWVGGHYRAFQIMNNLIKNPDGMIELINRLKEIQNEEVDNNTSLDAIEVSTEKVNDLVYAYNKATGEFLAQAQNLHQVMTLAAARYPGKKFWHPELKEDSQTA